MLILCYPYSDQTFEKHSYFLLLANDNNAMIRVKYVNSLEPTVSTLVSTPRVLPEMFNVPGQKKNIPIEPHPGEHYNSTEGRKPTSRDIFQGLF